MKFRIVTNGDFYKVQCKKLDFWRSVSFMFYGGLRNIYRWRDMDESLTYAYNDQPWWGRRLCHFESLEEAKAKIKKMHGVNADIEKPWVPAVK